MKIQWQWVLAAVVVFAIMQIILHVVFFVFGVLTIGLGFLFHFLIKPLAYFAAGFVIGMASPGITMVEPALAVALVTIVGGIFEASHPGLGQLLLIVMGGVIAAVLALVGAGVGERIQAARNA